MPKQVLKIDRFEGGLNTHFEDRDIPENSLVVADNVMVDVIGKIKPAGYTENLSDILGIDTVTAKGLPGYGLFSFSHDFTNPNTGTNLATMPAFDGAVVETYKETPAGSGITVWYGDTGSGDDVADDSEWHYETTYDSSTADDKPSTDTGNNSTTKGWYFDDDSDNRMVCDQANAGTPKNLKLYQKVGKPGKAYLVKATIQFVDAAGTNVNKVYIYGDGGYSLSTGTSNGVGYGLGKDADSDGTSSMDLIDIMVLPENTSGRLGLITNNDANVAIYVTNIDIYEVPSPRDTSYILTQNEQDSNVLDTSSTSWRTGVVSLATSLNDVKAGYYLADGTLRVFDANFANNAENKWYGFVERQNFLDTTITGVNGGQGFIRQWVQEDQQLYKPNITESVTAGDGNPGAYAVEFDDGITDNFAAPADGGSTNRHIKIHLGLMDETDATWKTTGSFIFYLSYLYDKSEQESALTEIHTANNRLEDSSGNPPAFTSDDRALRVGVTVDFDDSGYPFNKRIVGARLYYSDTADSEGFKYHLLDIDFKDGCRTFEDVEFTPWALVGAATAYTVECPEDTVSSADYDSTTKNFVFSTPPKVTWYDTINGYAPDEDIYFRYKTATIASDKLWAGNIGEVDSNGAITNRFSDRIITSPRGRFDILPREEFLEVAINDGDEIIRLESLADKLLVFKKKKMYVINISNDGNEFLESEHKFLGISHPAAVVKTEGGIAWVNNNGCFVYDGRNLANITENKIKPLDWSNFIGESGLVGFIPQKKQLFVLSDPGSYSLSTIYIYDFSTKSWTKAINAVGSHSKSNIINAHDSHGFFDGAPVFSSIISNVAESFILNGSFDANGTDAPVIQNANQGSSKALSTFAFGNPTTDVLGSGYEKIKLYVESTAGTFALNGNNTENGASGHSATILSHSINLSQLFVSIVGKSSDSQRRDDSYEFNHSHALDMIQDAINSYQASLGASQLFSCIRLADTLHISTYNDTEAYNGMKIRFAIWDGDTGSPGTWVDDTNAAESIDEMFPFSYFSGGQTPKQKVQHIAIQDVSGSTTTTFAISIQPTIIPSEQANNLDEGTWANAFGAWATIFHTGGTSTNVSAGADDSNLKIAQDICARINDNQIIQEAGLSTSTGGSNFGVYASTMNGTSLKDAAGNDIYHFALKGSSDGTKSFQILGTSVASTRAIYKFDNNNSKNIGGYRVITKDIDLGVPSVRKKIYKVYVTFRTSDVNGNYYTSGVKAYYGTNGEEITGIEKGGTFSTSTSKYYSSNGLDSYYSDSDLNTTLSGVIFWVTASNQLGKILQLNSVSNLKKGFGVKVDSEEMLIKGFLGLSTDNIPESNSIFTSNANWTQGSGWTINTGSALATTSGATISTTLYYTNSGNPIVPGEDYLVVVNANSSIEGSFTVSVGGGTESSSVSTTGSQKQYLRVTAGNTVAQSVLFNPSSWNGVLNSLKVYRIYDSSSDATSSDIYVDRGWQSTTPASHSTDAVAQIATTNWTTAELKPSSSINNIYSFQLKLEGGASIPSNFEINDISVVYKSKNIR